MYRIAVNHLLNIRKSNLEKQLNFTAFGEDLLNGLHAPSYDEPDRDLLAEEVKIGCTLGMLICLDRDLRISYILGEVFELTSKEAAEILDITAENFRKRLSKARLALRDFMKSYCGLTNKNNACRCDKRINYAISKGRVDPKNLNFVSHNTLAKSKTEMEELYTTSAVFKSHPSLSVKDSRFDEILAVVGNLKGLLGR